MASELNSCLLNSVSTQHGSSYISSQLKGDGSQRARQTKRCTAVEEFKVHGSSAYIINRGLI